MLRIRFALSLAALLALPLMAGAAQSRGQDESSKCTPDQAAAIARARAAGRPVPPGLAKKNCEPPAPPSEAPPVGPHKALGMVFEESDGVAGRDAFSGEGGLAGFTVQLFYKPTGALAASAVSDASGNFEFGSLGNGTWFVCVVPLSAYTQVHPVAGTGCSGRGYEFTLSGSIETWVMNNDFGMTQ